MTKKKASNLIAKRPGPGHPTAYRPEYCEQLIQHSKSGGSFEAFAGKIGHSIQTLYGWMQANAEFLEARRKAQGYLHVFYEGLGVAISTGSLKRLKSETVVRDATGNPVFDAEGKPVMDRQYEPVAGNATAWIFMTRNMLGWRNDVEINLNLPGAVGSASPITEVSDGMTPEERFREMVEMMEVIKQIQERDEAIDVTPVTKPA